VHPSDEVMLISTGGVLIRTRVQDIRELGRATQGVTLINLDEGTWLAGIEKVAESDADDALDNGTGDAERSPGGGGAQASAPDADAAPQ
jgi:DNA gyrase subunit A